MVNYEEKISIINEIILECSFFINKWIKDLRKLQENGFRNIFSIALNMRLNRNGDEKEYTINNEAMSHNGKPDISIAFNKNYRFLYIVEVKIYKSTITLKKALIQVVEYINPENQYASIIVINKEKHYEGFNENIKKIDTYLHKLHEEEKIEQMLYFKEQKYWSFYYIISENFKIQIFLYYFNFYGKCMNKPHIKTDYIIKKEKINQKELNDKRDYIVNQKSKEGISEKQYNKKEILLYKVSKIQQASLKYTQKNIEKIKEETKTKEKTKELEGFLKEYEYRNKDDQEILNKIKEVIEKYLKTFYIVE
ncbi:hypothetical protein [Candidatus Phytoplasma meliae]|uniref:Uncharacterized protein n=1 Tax=Candidatus Phytoplasma meliae TaxID=1848402 RepID=A0ABS5CXX7_9MOLU|nr:hypothetical protein [Candidatus Phytoplasma meliae]MBP5835826.1 hypothetical protein [Candidatus Phytoplasma meliae]